MTVRWRVAIAVTAFVLPLLATAAGACVRAFPDSWLGGLYLHPAGLREKIPPFDGHGVLVDLALVPVMALVFDWPFFVLAAWARRHVLRYWPDAACAHAAVAAGLAGLLLVYLPLYAVLPLEIAMNAGAGVSLVLPIAGPTVGGLCAYLGFRLGPLLVRRWRRGPGH